MAKALQPCCCFPQQAIPATAKKGRQQFPTLVWNVSQRTITAHADDRRGNR
jgi:hypothetical protein